MNLTVLCTSRLQRAQQSWLSWLISWLVLWLVTATAVLGLGGCASSAPDTQPLLDAHLAQFAKAQPHQVLQVPRSGGHLLAVREFGQVHKGRGPSLVLMHGFPDNQHLYDLLIPLLAKQHHVVSFDFLGWGDSDKPTGHRYNVASQRADLEAVVKHLALQQVAPVVHDLSGQVGIDWALDNPSRTHGLVLLNTYYQNMPTLKAPEAIQTYSTPGWWRDLLVWAANKSGTRFKAGVASQLGLFFSNPTSRDQFIPVLTHDVAAIRPAFFSSTAELWPEVEAREKELPRMRAFAKPVWIVFGADDPYLNVGVAAEFKAIFANSSLHLLPNAGHYVQLDRADEVARVVLAGLAGLAGVKAAP
jgi:haloalkane dehalogenase